MRKVVAGSMMLLFANAGFAADVGVGIGAQSNEASIYLPIEWTSGYRLEPGIRFSKSVSTTEEPFTASRSGSTLRQESHSFEFGVGAFRLFSLSESGKVSVGVRLSWVDSKSDLKSESTSTTGPFSFYRSETSFDGYRIAPTIGLEYLLGERFSIGGEVGYSFLDLDGSGSTQQTAILVGGPIGSSLNLSSTINVQQRSNGTDSQLILRYKF